MYIGPEPRPALRSQARYILPGYASGWTFGPPKLPQLINRTLLRDSECVGIVCYAVSFLFQSVSIRDNNGGAKIADQEVDKEQVV
ncbi:hypothetical protein Pla52o_11640 [Novipirellula galeiformis]|uniref:Uncharacterized protein n=1 Tax=Novipirellula galeiformis TaxID=2528004 RepID=A0A5C6CQ13_9BACT|nr:hypothetical protein Pla52o_11640 [Novipirellula galeiformis]